MPASILVASYEDGSEHRCRLADWLRHNAHDSEALGLLQRLQAGLTVYAGGGAQPLCRLWLEAPQGIVGTIQRDGTVTLQWNCQCDRLLSPDGSQHCLPCERCGDAQWVALGVVATLCDRCAQDLSEDLGDLGPAVASGEISEADAILTVARREVRR